MLKAHAHTFRSRGRLAVGLSWLAGYTNVITLVAAGQTVSHQTGNTTHLGEQVGHALLHRDAAAVAEAAYFAGLVGSFGVGAFVSGTLTEWARRAGRRSRFVLPLTVEGVLLTVVAMSMLANPHPVHGRPLVAVTFVAAVAMGLQNATITRISGAVVRTTHLTGVTTDLGLDLSSVAAELVDAVRAGRPWRAAVRHLGRHPAFRRAVLLGAIFASFLTGALLGTLAYGPLGAGALGVPVVFLTMLVVREQLAAVAEVRPVPPPAEWAGVLPADVGLFHLVHSRPGRPDHPPDFTTWAERLPADRRVVILSIDRQTRFHDDAAINLLSAVGLLREQGRTLVVAGLDRSQLKRLRRNDPHRRVKWADFPPDVEFAVARALNLTARDTAATF